METGYLSPFTKRDVGSEDIRQGGIVADPDEFISRSSEVGSNTSAVISLSRRQREVLELLVQGCTNKEIASVLNLAKGTVKIHVSVLFHKLGVKSRTTAAVAGARLMAQKDLALPTSLAK